jgi:erythromycin esterase-like protein
MSSAETRIIDHPWRLATHGARWVLAFCTLFGLAAGASAAPASAVDRLVHDVCGKRVVLLGEDNWHAGGRTLEVKAQIVQRLIDHCGFSAVLWEGQIYDFLDFERAVTEKRATREQLLDAIGGLWSTSAEIDPLVDYLLNAARRGRVRVAGIDPNVVGATARYTDERLPVDLSAALPEPRRSECRATLHQWRYNEDADPAPARARTGACVTEIEQALAQRAPDARTSELKQMAHNVAVAIALGDDWAPRDRAMYENFLWQRARSPKNAKIIVWCATVHALPRQEADGRARLGFFVRQLLGKESAVIGFSAAAGSHGRGTIKALAPAAPESLEARALAGSDADVYLDKAALQRFGSIEARARSYQQPETLAWGGLLDGLLVLREERPQHVVRRAQPQQPPFAAAAP